MSLQTTVKTKKAKICLFAGTNAESENDRFEELYLSNRNEEEDDELDHLIIQKITTKEGVMTYHINGREVEPRIIEEIVRFLMD